MINPLKIDAITALCPNAVFSVYSKDGVDTINWVDMKGDSVPSDSAITAKWDELKKAYNDKEYSRKRADEYPSLVDQLDDIYHNGIDAWKATIKAVKDKYPKS